MDLSNIKGSFLSLGLIFFTFVTPIRGMFLLVFMAICADTFLGLFYAFKKKEFRIEKFFNVFVKIIFYWFIILFSFIVSKEMFQGKLFGIEYLSVKVVTALWIYIEFTSIDKTSQQLGNKPFVEIIRNLMKKAKEIKKDINELKK